LSLVLKNHFRKLGVLCGLRAHITDGWDYDLLFRILTLGSELLFSSGYRFC
jgi:hypothetical protein